jgi:malonyl-ACP O-methyltransferase BioC
VKADPSSRYEEYAHAQRLAAHDLLLFTGALDPRTILEPGCGTGLYSRFLLEAFPRAAIVAVDLSETRVTRARRDIASPAIRFETGDAEELPLAPYDLITSNAAFQWFRRLPLTLARFARMLAGGGALSFSFFGPGTYGELDDAMGEVFHGRARVTASGFAGRDILSSALAACFPRWNIEEKTYTQVFPSLHELLRGIKFTETRGAPRGSRIAWTRGALARVEEVYRKRWGRIQASYKVYLCKGLVP